jgi:hypothetical protein
MPRRRIDVHHHIVPPAYAGWLASQGVSDAGGRELPAWSANDALALMESHDIATAVVSISTPGVHLRPGIEYDAVARAKAREVNEVAARLAHDHPGRFGFFATLPVPDVDAALEELTYGCDAARHVAETDRIPVRAVRIGHLDGDYRDPRCTWLRHRQIGPRGAVLVRPDRFVGWRSSDPSSDAASELRSALTSILCLENE